jgi:hypothetical protein
MSRPIVGSGERSRVAISRRSVLDRGMESGPDTGKAPSPGGSGPRISLLGGFQLETDDEPALILPEGSQRLLAFLALKGRLIQRQTVAGTLWPVAQRGPRLLQPPIGPGAAAGRSSNLSGSDRPGSRIIRRHHRRSLGRARACSPAARTDCGFAVGGSGTRGDPGALGGAPAGLVRRVGTRRGRGLAAASPPRPGGARRPPHGPKEVR